MREARALVVLCVWLALPGTALAGAYVFSGETNGLDLITHPTGYAGTGGVVNVSVCIDPASPNASASFAC